ncbi:MAG: AAA family ATPase, partial [candidate division Zixibacteria bacterium]|nr:AAA family ATPase [candidate division Zixibacteria bacterium]
MTSQPPSDHELVGRQQELAELARALDEADAGRGGLVLLSGEAGIGKTRLAVEALNRSDLPVYIARTREGTSPPYGPIVSVLRAWIRKQPAVKDELIQSLPALGLLLPELGTESTASSREILADAIGQALHRLTDADGCTILLDDLHWADNATFELLPELAER